MKIGITMTECLFEREGFSYNDDDLQNPLHWHMTRPHVLFCAQPEHKSVLWMLEDETIKFEALYAKFDKILFEI